MLVKCEQNKQFLSPGRQTEGLIMHHFIRSTKKILLFESICVILNRHIILRAVSPVSHPPLGPCVWAWLPINDRPPLLMLTVIYYSEPERPSLLH